jgi:hypothetical protein
MKAAHGEEPADDLGESRGISQVVGMSTSPNIFLTNANFEGKYEPV